jgi:L-threonylcarbamoyladenylate synthase
VQRVVRLPGSEAFDAVVEVLRDGGTVVLPTDTVYGIAALANDPSATAKLFALKGRPEEVPLAVLVESLAQAETIVEPPSPRAARVIERYWPGPLTVVLKCRAGARVALGGDGRTAGVRAPAHAFIREVAAAVGPIATTSANRHGQPTPVTADEAASGLAGGVDLVIDGGPLSGVPSTVIDGTVEALTILRAGTILREQVEAAALP